MIAIVLILAAAGLGAGIVYVMKKHKGYLDEINHERFDKFLAGEIEITDEELAEGSLDRVPDSEDGGLSGCYLIRNPSRGLMLIRPSNNMLKDLLKELCGFHNRDIASDSNSGRLMVSLHFPKDGESLVTLLNRVREEQGITEMNDYAVTDDRNVMEKLPKKSASKKASASTRRPMSWER